jgi:hypothetical protein
MVPLPSEIRPWRRSRPRPGRRPRTMLRRRTVPPRCPRQSSGRTGVPAQVSVYPAGPVIRARLRFSLIETQFPSTGCLPERDPGYCRAPAACRPGSGARIWFLPVRATRPAPAARPRMTAEAAKAPHQTAAGLSYASDPASSADLTAGQRAQVKVPGERTRESALDTSPPANRSAAVSPMEGKGDAQGPQPTPLIRDDSADARSGRRRSDPGALRRGVRSACDSERPTTVTATAAATG